MSERALPLGYRPALDGLRAVAVLAVMLRHTGVLPGGYLGVDVFFTLSGFLITTLILEELAETGAVSFRGFYIRRALRLLPALAPVVVIAGAAMLADEPALPMLAFVLSVLFYSANWAGISSVPQGMLGHTWSLSIEEQFYLLWPPVLLLLVRRLRRPRAVFMMVLAMTVAAIAVRPILALAGAGLRHMYFGLHAHADPLIGCLLGVACAAPAFRRAARGARRWSAVGAGAGIALIGLFVTSTFPVSYVWHGAATATGVATALVIVAVMLPGRQWTSVLEVRPLVWIGRRSYGLYLWHLPIFFMLGALSIDGRASPWAPAVLAWACTLAIAGASFRYLEQPALALKSRFSDAARPAHRRRSAPAAPPPSPA